MNPQLHYNLLQDKPFFHLKKRLAQHSVCAVCEVDAGQLRGQG